MPISFLLLTPLHLPQPALQLQFEYSLSHLAILLAYVTVISVLNSLNPTPAPPTVLLW
jgi:hypothetical protein